MSSLSKNTYREILRSPGRFLAILAIIVLGSGFFVGLRVSQKAMKATADTYLEKTAFYDFSVATTLGLTDGDVEALMADPEVLDAEGSVETDALVDLGVGTDLVYAFYSLPERINTPDLLEGRLPSAPGECLADSWTNLAVGDKVILSAQNDQDTLDLFTVREFTVTGIATSPLYLNFERGSTSLGAGSVTAFCYVPLSAFDTDYYTRVYLRCPRMGAAYSDGYNDRADALEAHFTDLANERAEARYASVVADAQAELADGWDEYNDSYADYESQRADAEAELADAQAELEDAKSELEDAAGEIEDGKKELADGKKELADNEQTLRNSEKELAEAKRELDDAAREIDDGWREYNEGAAELEDNRRTLSDSKAELNEAKTRLDEAALEIDDGRREYDEGVRTLEEERQNGLSELADAQAELEDAKAVLDAGEAEYGENLALYNEGLEQYDRGVQAYNESAEYVSSLEAQYEAGLARYRAGKREYDAGKAKLEEARPTIEEYRPLLSSYDTLTAFLLMRITDYSSQDELMAAIGQALAGERPEEDPLILKVEDLLGKAHGINESAPTTAQELLEMDAKVAALRQAVKEFDENDAYLQGVGASLASAESQLDSAERQLDSARAELSAGWETLEETKRELDEAKAQLDAGRTELDEGWAEYERGLAGYGDAEAEFDASVAKAEAELADANARLEDAQVQYDQGLAEYEEGLEAYNEGLAQFTDAEAELAGAKAELEDAQAQYDQGLAEYEEGLEAYNEGLQKYEDGKAEIAQAEADLADAQQRYADGLAEYEEGLAEYEDARSEADREFADAEAELADARGELEDAQREIDDIVYPDAYLLGRWSNLGYVCFENDTSIVRSISSVFPVFFFLVAALICVTTVSRMVEEQRSQLGVLMALGYSRLKVMGKFLIYSGTATVLGCVTGILIGSKMIPLVVWQAYKIMYSFSDKIEFYFDLPLSAVTFALYLAAMMAVTWLSCRREVTDVPANVIRPKPPKAGKRVLLERVPLIWNHLSFLWKVTVRNIFRYKLRVLMMILGVAGCTALMLTGMGVNDSIKNVVDYQFTEISLYDYSVTFSGHLSEREREDFLQSAGDFAEDALFLHQATVTAAAGHSEKEVQLSAVDAGGLERIGEFMDFHKGAKKLPFPARGEALINSGLARAMGLSAGDTLELRDADGAAFTVTVSGVYDNYIYNTVYISSDTLPGESEINYALVLKNASVDTGEALAEILGMDNVLTASASLDLRTRIGNMMASLIYIVLLTVVCAAALAFVVIYNLTNINIQERLREIATVKVLGFYDSESALYVLRENILLTLLGTAAGIPLGLALNAFVIGQIKLDIIHFTPRVAPLSYLASVALTILFSLLVDLFMLRRLNTIDPASALKAAE